MWQQLVVALVVAGAFGYSAWVLMPAGWRLALRRRLGLAAPQQAGGCGGCGGGAGCGAPARPPAVAVMQVHRRRPGGTP